MAIGWTLRDAILGHPAHVDNPAKPYSLRGPIYVPISDRSTITRGLTTDTIRRGQVGNKKLRFPWWDRSGYRRERIHCGFHHLA